MKIDVLDALSPLDGRYRDKVEKLARSMSERGLVERRVFVSTKYLQSLSDEPLVTHLRKFEPWERKFLRSLHVRARKNARIVKLLETGGRGKKKKKKGMNHDVAATIAYIKTMLSRTSLRDVTGWVHFALTSEDLNNIAYALQLRDGLEKGIVPALEALARSFLAVAEDNVALALLSRTHGQPATPTTLGKEFRVFAERLLKELEKLRHQEITVKLNGASGNWCAHVAAYPEVNWPQFSVNFIEKLNRGKHTVRLVPNLVTTQIEPHDTYAVFFDRLKRINTILVAFCQDIWRYISDDWIVQKALEGEVGSSAMPHKVNPIDFENAEGNLQYAVSICEFFARTLPISRLQRHLSDSTIIRNFGVALGHSLIAYKSIARGLGKIAPNHLEIKNALKRHPEVVAEAIQIILRREGISDAYDILKKLTRGKPMTTPIIRKFVQKLRVEKSVKRELLTLTPAKYIGLAPKIAKKGQEIALVE